MTSAKHASRLLALAALAIAAADGLAAARSADGVVVLANRDDDDRDGVPDADDEQVNGPADARDLVAVTIPVPEGTTRVRLSAGESPLRFFVRDGDSWRHLGRGACVVKVPADDDRGELVVHVEAAAWAGLPAGWSGSGTIAASGDGPAAASKPAEIPFRIAPVRLLPSTAEADEIFVATGRYDNAGFLAALQGVLRPLGVPLRVHPARDWREMWMQDTMEIGIATAADSRMHVVLAGLRNADTFPPTLLGPDVAVAEVAAARPLAGGDAWADWYGNLETSVPTPARPQGRVIHGRNRLTGCSFHPDAVAFLAAQGEQSPVWIDTSWLLIKHVDEIVAFMPGPDGAGVILVPDPEEGLRLLGDAGSSEEAVVVRRREANGRIARLIEAMLTGGDPAGAGGFDRAEDARGGLLGLLGLDRSRVVRLPVAFDVPPEGLLADGGVTNASSLWSNPVNALLVNGNVICGAAGMPEPVREICRERFLAAGADRVEFIDDGCYQKHHGNVHCGTNARRSDERPQSLFEP